ncbi:MAG: molybdopterin-synthase adenylyltransferase MoeB [Wenzhouxiangellaceae bacterium]|nr:molybdopterin-synthase adenylyltransferase MoeB [Wenzhouxiangellaceae bacterium]
MSLNQRLSRLREQIPMVSPSEAQRRQRAGAALIDVREADEIAQGMAEGAQPLGRGYLEIRIAEAVPDDDQPVLVICGSSTRSLLAADDLKKLGYRDVGVVEGGFNQWKDEGLPVVAPERADADARQRYARQMVLPEVGEAGQAKLGKARVLLIGAGGLGSPAALYLAGAGVGTLGLVDHDRVDRSNLHRQVLHRDDRVGWPKTQSARATIEALNPRVAVQIHDLRLNSGNVDSLFSGYDIVVDGSDNFPTRYLVNDACLKLGLVCIYGAVQGFEGQVSVFPAGGRPCYRCLFSEPPPAQFAPSCNEAGVIGIVPGLIGLLQAMEVIKQVLGIGESLAGRLLLFDGRDTRMRELKLAADPACAYCRPGAKFPGYVDYVQFCGSRTADAHRAGPDDELASHG